MVNRIYHKKWVPEKEVVSRKLLVVITCGLVAFTSGFLGSLRCANQRTERNTTQPTPFSVPVSPSPSPTPQTTPEMLKYRINGSDKYGPLYGEPINFPKEIQPATKPFVNVDENEKKLLAEMIFGEARGCSREEKIAVAYTAINRVNDRKRWNGTTLTEVIKKPFQYSCFNHGNPNKTKLENPERYNTKAWDECLDVAKIVLSKEVNDPTNGATHYFNPRIVKPRWAYSPQMERINLKNPERYAHIFFREN